VLFFSTIIANRGTQTIVFKYIDVVTVSLISAIAKEQGSFLEKISQALVILLNNAELLG